MTTTPAPSIAASPLSGLSTGPFPTGFKYGAAEDVHVWIELAGVRQPDLTQGSDYTLTGATPLVDGGTVTLDASVVPAEGWDEAAGDRVVIERRTYKSQALALPNSEGHKPKATEAALDKLMRTSEEAADGLSRAVTVPAGEPGFQLPNAASRQEGVAEWRDGGLQSTPLIPGQFLVADADGRLTQSVGTTGADDALRTDLVTPSGASLIGVSGGGSLQGALNAMLAQQGAYARDYPPYSNGVYYGDVWPNAVNIMASARMSSTLWLVRCWRDGVVDETVVRDAAGYVGVDAGVQIVSERSFYRGQVYEWLRNPVVDGAMTIVDFAIRIGPYSEPYHSGGEGPTYAFTGYGHGRMVSDGTPQIILDGAGANLWSEANWPVGVRKNGDSLSMQCLYRLKYWTVAVDPPAWSGLEAVAATRNLGFGEAGGVNQLLSDTLSLTPLIEGVGIQDAYCPMAAVNFGGYADTAKLDGQPAVPMVGSDTQKGNWNTGVSGTRMQFYNAANPHVVRTTEIVYGPPLRINGVDQNWSKNQFGRIHVTDGKDFSKFRAFICSSAAAIDPPRTAWPMAMGETWSMLTRRRTDILPGGPL